MATQIATTMRRISLKSEQEVLTGDVAAECEPASTDLTEGPALLPLPVALAAVREIDLADRLASQAYQGKAALGMRTARARNTASGRSSSAPRCRVRGLRMARARRGGRS